MYVPRPTFLILEMTDMIGSVTRFKSCHVACPCSFAS
jgi:hypothetical protein